MEPLTLASAFEDDLTRELPSALRTFTDLEPFEIADEDSVAIENTRTHSTTSGTGSLPSISPIAIDIGPPPAALPTSTEWRRRARALLADRHVLMAAGGAALLASLLASVMILVVLVAAPSRKPPAAAVATIRAPRIALVEGAREAVFEPPPMAPAKEEVSEVPEVTAPPARVVVRRVAPRRPAPPPPPAAPGGRGHMGSDRAPPSSR